jgi:hypothetical protein
MKMTHYEFAFESGSIYTSAFSYEEALILAQAEAINRGWNYKTLKYFKVIC